MNYGDFYYGVCWGMIIFIVVQEIAKGRFAKKQLKGKKRK